MKYRCNECDPPCKLEVDGNEGLPDGCTYSDVEWEPDWKVVTTKKKTAKRKAPAKASGLSAQDRLANLLF